jgi:hypothetical protein
MTTATAAKPASEKQTNLIKKLVGEKQCPADFVADMSSSRKASDTIDKLFSFPRKPQESVASTGVGPGIYIAPNGDVIQVKMNKAETNVYAKVAVAFSGERLNLHGEVVKFRFVYTPGLIKHITPAMKMTKEQGEEYTLKFKQCMACGRTLKAAKSVQAGIGPVCIKYFQ